MQSTDGQADPTSAPAPSVKARYRTIRGSEYLSIHDVENVKEVYIYTTKHKFEVLRRDIIGDMTLPKTLGLPTYYDLLPHHIKLWPAPEQTYEVEVVYA